MGRIISIDLGLKRTGLAVTDPEQIVASALETIETRKLFVFLKNYFNKEQVEEIILGYPTKLNGTATDMTKHVLSLEKKLKADFPDKSVHLEDERFTSVLAQRAILSSGIKKEKRKDKSLVDKVSAVIILQSYLERKR